MNNNVTALPSELESIEKLTENLHRLMQLKKINEAGLARQTNIPQPTLHKILSGKTSDPRASTLKSLADFFKISIDELLTGTVMTSPTNIAKKTQSIPVISWSQCISSANFLNGLTSSNWNNWIVTEYLSSNAYGLTSKSSMEPRFPKGTILVIDPNQHAEDGDLVVVLYPNTSESTLRELSIDGPTKLLLPISINGTPTALDPDIEILGVVIKSVFSYHF